MTGGPRVLGAALAAMLTAVLVLAACGTPPEDSPRLISEDELQFDPALTVTTTTTTTSAPTTEPVGTLPEPATQTVTVYYVNDEDRLVPVQRDLRAPTDLTSVLSALLTGPDALEQAVGLRSTLPPGSVVRVNVDRGIAEVVLKATLLDEILTRDQVLAFAQLVLTLTAQPGIGQVTFTSGGEAISAQRGDGSVARPEDRLTYEDYAELIEGYEAPVTPSSTTSSTTSTSSTTVPGEPRASATTTTTSIP